MAKKTNDTSFGSGDGRAESFSVVSMDNVMHDSMLPYAEHVILERALPRVEDGLKPVQRRILYTMLELSNTPDKPHRKSARIVGDCLGKFHPHGDSSVYDAMVRMAQGFNMRLPLVDGHGNFGSVDGDSAAAMRYTEARMAPAATELLRDIDKDTVKFCLNFDDTLKEPELLPGRFPNLLINGSNGIAVGLTTSIPPHNPAEAIDAVIARIDNPNITLDEIMKIMPCPDFPTGGYIINSEEIRAAYDTGRGKLTNRAKIHFENLKNGKKLIVVTEFPYQVNKAAALEKILKLCQEKKSAFAGVTDIRDESDRTGTRAVIELRKDTDENKVLKYLLKYSDLQKTFGVIMVAIAEGRPRQLSLMEIIDYYIGHQEDVVTRRCKCELEIAERRGHILEGLMIALLNIDEVIALIRSSKSPKIAKQGLMERFALSTLQADAILDLRLQRLTNLEQIAIKKEHNEVVKEIERLKGILSSKNKLHKLIKSELLNIREGIVDPRRTMLINDDTLAVDEDKTDSSEPAVLLVLKENKLRRILPKLLTSEIVESDEVMTVLNTTTSDMLRLFTNRGSMLSIAVSDIPELKLATRPTNISALLPIDNDELILEAWVGDRKTGRFMFYTAQGMVKSTAAEEYNAKAKRISAINLKDGDELIKVEYLDDEKDKSILIITKKGMGIRFSPDSVPITGRQSAGVHGIKLEARDRVLYASSVTEEGEILTVSDRGYMKRSFVFDHEIQGRNGRGSICFGFKKNGSNGNELVGVLHIKEPRDIAIQQAHGTSTALSTEDIKIEPRNGKGQLAVMVIMDDLVVSIK